MQKAWKILPTLLIVVAYQVNDWLQRWCKHHFAFDILIMCRLSVSSLNEGSRSESHPSHYLTELAKLSIHNNIAKLCRLGGDG